MQTVAAGEIAGVRGVRIRNYKSVARCHVKLGALTFLVGPNGAGKSNFLDAIRFVSDALNTTVENALRDRGGIQAVRRRSRGRPNHFAVRLDLVLPDGSQGFYAFQIADERDGGFSVRREECQLEKLFAHGSYFTVRDGVMVSSSAEVHSSLERDRLALVALSGLPEFRPVYDHLTRMGFYNLDPRRIRDLQDPDPGQVLARDGRNLAALVRELRRSGSDALSEITEHLRAVVPGVVAVEQEAVGRKETLVFRQEGAGDDEPWDFQAESMSDGTLRALGILVAAFQGGQNGRRGVSLVAIEEPEIALHPGATEIITVALLLASQRVQVLATTHSPELLNHKDIKEENLLAVSSVQGETIVGPVDAASRSAIHDQLYAPGELLSQGQIEPDQTAVAASDRQLQLFSDDN
jgi:predicted ATPase